MKAIKVKIPPFDRRRFLALSGQGLGYSALVASLPGCGGSGGGGAPAPTPAPTPAGLPPASAEVLAVQRTSFGASQGALAEVQAVGIDAFLEQQIDYTTIDDSVVEAEVAARFPLANADPATLRNDFPNNFQNIVEDLVGATLFREFFSPRQLYEVMVEFWTNHFSIHLINGVIPLLKPQDDFAVIRPNAMRSFAEILHASAKSPAMLYYLDNFLNFAGAPQENYARELLELHTLGVDGGYTEDDVKEVARCFTGWTIDQNTGQFLFVPILHDPGTKVVLGTVIPPGGGITDGETVLDLLAAHPSTARFIATKLCRRFVADDPPGELVDEVAAAFEQSNGDIPTLLRTLFASDAFRESGDMKLGRPMEFLGRLVRAFNGPTDFPADDARLYFAVLNILGQIPFYWIPPNGYPDVAGYWGSTSGFLNRWRLALALNVPAIREYFPVEQAVAGAMNLAEVIDSTVDFVLHRELAAEDRELVLTWLEDELGIDRDVPLDAATVDALAPFVVALFVSSPYFQLR